MGAGCPTYDQNVHPNVNDWNHYYGAPWSVANQNNEGEENENIAREIKEHISEINTREPDAFSMRALGFHFVDACS